MTVSFPEQLARWAQQRGRARRDSKLVAFLAARHDVQAAIDAGYAAKTVWANLHETGRIHFSYKTFLNYVKRFVGPPGQGYDTSQPQARAGASSASVLPPTGMTETQAGAAPGATAGFVFNPVPDKKELL